jgi:hypothetical protein
VMHARMHFQIARHDRSAIARVDSRDCEALYATAR